MLCIASAGAVVALAASSFTLGWTHSVERTEWLERWEVTPAGLQLFEASVEGSGAGIDLPADAIWSDGRWTYQPRLPPVESLTLAASGMTVTPWTLCTGRRCMTLGAESGETAKLWFGKVCEGY